MLNDIAARNELIALAILIAGVIGARLVSMAVVSILGLVDRRMARLATTEKSIISPRLIRVTRAIVFWLVLVLAVSFSLRILGVGDISTLASGVIDFIPELLVAITIVIAGHVAGLIAGHLVSELSDEITTESIGPRLLHGAIVTVAVVMGLQHINVDISFVTRLMLIVVAIAGGGFMLSFALGARQHVANLLARRELSRLSVGDRIRVDEVEGEVIDIHATGIDVATSDGVASVPAARLAETGFLRLADIE